jgi:hypothetical protein
MAMAWLAGVAHAGDAPVSLIWQERTVDTFLIDLSCGEQAMDFQEAPGFGAFEATLLGSIECAGASTDTETHQVSSLDHSLMEGFASVAFAHDAAGPSTTIAGSASTMEAIFSVSALTDYSLKGVLSTALEGGDVGKVEASVSLYRVEGDEFIFAYDLTHADGLLEIDVVGDLEQGSYLLRAEANAVLTDANVDQVNGLGTFDFQLVIAGGCAGDFNEDGTLDILDFVSFQEAFASRDPSADCDGNGALNILDFVCFQSLFQSGCM